MAKITTISPTGKFPKVETRTVEFSFESDDYSNFCITAEVEISGEGARRSYTCVNHDADGRDGGELSDSMWRRIAEKAEEIVCDREERPRNKRGCNCPPQGEGTLAEIEHERDCPLKLRGEEREAFDDLVRKEKREAHRFSRSEYEQERRREIDVNTEIYLNLK